MFTLKNYVQVKSLEEAYALKLENRKNVILGGNLWAKMGNLSFETGIDLSLLNLDKITETEEEFVIGCMCSLRDLEIHPELNKTFNNAFKEALRHIVGVQFRNTATVGGSVFPRYGFSDVLTVFSSLDTYVELYKGGIIPLKTFIDMRMDNDILVNVIVKKDGRKAAYHSLRMTETDFAVVTCAVSKKDDLYTVVLGATPSKAKIVDGLTEADLENVTDSFIFGSNNRGSAEYRKMISKVLIKRAVDQINEVRV